MQNPTPTRQELSSYFFDRCTPEISNKVERWFFKNGNSQEAKKLLFSLWEELEDTTSSTSPEEIQAAFVRFNDEWFFFIFCHRKMTFSIKKNLGDFLFWLFIFFIK